MTAPMTAAAKSAVVARADARCLPSSSAFAPAVAAADSVSPPFPSLPVLSTRRQEEISLTVATPVVFCLVGVDFLSFFFAPFRANEKKNKK